MKKEFTGQSVWIGGTCACRDGAWQPSNPSFESTVDDAVGGWFAINGGALGPDQRNIYNYAPDSLHWEPCGFGYSTFLEWGMSEKLAEFYESLRWDGWQSEARELTGHQMISIYPFLFAEGRRSRSVRAALSRSPSIRPAA